jgi:hypothetical protein
MIMLMMLCSSFSDINTRGVTWLDMIETMCNEILGNYTKKEDQLMTTAFDTRPKQILNRVMDALKFEYPDYERLDKGAEGVKRKRIVSILIRQATFPKKRRARTLEPKITEATRDSFDASCC